MAVSKAERQLKADSILLYILVQGLVIIKAMPIAYVKIKAST